MIDSLVYITWYLQTIYHSRSRNIHAIEYFADSAVGASNSGLISVIRQGNEAKRVGQKVLPVSGYMIMDIILRYLIFYECYSFMSAFGYRSILVSSFLPRSRRRQPNSPRGWHEPGPFPYWLGFTTFPFFISTIKPAVRGETMASCRSSTWAFLRGEKSV